MIHLKSIIIRKLSNPNKARYEDLEQIKLVKAFLQNPEAYLRHL